MGRNLTETEIRNLAREEIKREFDTFCLDAPVWFECPECQRTTLAKKFIPEAMFGVIRDSLGNVVNNPYGVALTEHNLIGRHCMHCGGKFLPIPTPQAYKKVEQDDMKKV